MIGSGEKLASVPIGTGPYLFFNVGSKSPVKNSAEGSIVEERNPRPERVYRIPVLLREYVPVPYLYE